MGILTTPESARSFTSYVATFGLALFISSVVYLKRVDNSEDKLNCTSTEESFGIPSCAQIDSWRGAAIAGIVVGVVDALLIPFLIGCVVCTTCSCCIACLCCYGCPKCTSQSSDNENKTRSTTTRNGDTELTETTTINVEDDDPPPKSTNKYDIQNVPSKLHCLLNTIGWIVWVAGPFGATLYIVITLYKHDGIRTRNDDLFSSALVLYIIALLNLMVYFQKFLNSLCGYGHKKVTEK